MKLILCIKNQTLEQIIIPDLITSFKDFEEKETRHEDYIKMAVTELKIKYDRIIKSRPWEIYLVVESRMNDKKNFVIRMRKEYSIVKVN